MLSLHDEGAGEFGGDTSRGAALDEAAHGFDGLGGGVVEAPVSTVAFHRLDELRFGVGHVHCDDLQSVGLPTPRHPDINPCRARRAGEHRVRGSDSCALDAVRDRRIRQVRILTHVLGRECNSAEALAPAVGDVLDDPGLPVRRPERGVSVPGLGHITASLLSLAQGGRNTSIWRFEAGPFLLGAGMAFVLPPMTTRIVSTSPRTRPAPAPR